MVRYRASDPDGNLAGIRYNVWNSTTGYFDNGGGGFAPASGGSGEVDHPVTLNTGWNLVFFGLTQRIRTTPPDQVDRGREASS